MVASGLFFQTILMKIVDPQLMFVYQQESGFANWNIFDSPVNIVN